MKEFVRISMLLDHYGILLTDKQNEILKMYYEEDYSLGEIAELYQISRQAAHDAIKKGEALLSKYENTLHLLQKQSMREGSINEIKDLAQTLSANGHDKNILKKIENLLDMIINE
jgi:hypothetical protein